MELSNAREIVKSMCDDIEVMNVAAEAYMDAVKTRIDIVTKSYENTLLKLINRIELAVDVLDDDRMISQYPVEDQEELKSYLSMIRNVLKENRKKIYETKDLHWLSDHC